MKKNEGISDRILRALVAVLLAVIGYFWLSGIWSVVLYVLAVILLITAVTGFCGLYKLLKIDTLKK